MHQVVAFSGCSWGKCNSSKSKMKMLIVRCTRNQMSSNLHRKTREASPIQPWWSVRGAIPTFDVNRCSLPGSMFCVCLLRLGLAVTGAPAENFGTRIHGVTLWNTGSYQCNNHLYARVSLAVYAISKPGCLVMFSWRRRPGIYSCGLAAGRRYSRIAGRRCSRT